MNSYPTDTGKHAPRFPLAMSRWIQERCVTEPNAIQHGRPLGAPD